MVQLSEAYPWPSEFANGPLLRHSFAQRKWNWRCARGEGHQCAKLIRNCRSQWYWFHWPQPPVQAIDHACTIWASTGGRRPSQNTTWRLFGQDANAHPLRTYWWWVALKGSPFLMCQALITSFAMHVELMATQSWIQNIWPLKALVIRLCFQGYLHNSYSRLTNDIELTRLSRRVALPIGCGTGIHATVFTDHFIDDQGPIVQDLMPTLHRQHSAIWKKENVKISSLLSQHSKVCC